jgi:hypothetical protein
MRWRAFVIRLLDRPADGPEADPLLDLDGFRLVRVAFDQVADRLGYGRGEENGLPLVGSGGEDLFDVLAEAHVEHAVGLVEHDHLDRAELQGASIHVIHDAAGRADHDLDTFFQLEKLALVRRLPP